MKICIFGAGAIGGLLGAELTRSGHEISLIARGPHLSAIQKNGLKLIRDKKEQTTYPFATDDPVRVGPQDYVFITLKAHSVPSAVEHIQPLLGASTAIVTAVNGLPWWYFYKTSGLHSNKRLAAVDPRGKQWEGLGPERAIGCVVYPAAEISQPGIIQHIEGDRFTLGEPDGSRSERVKDLSKALIESGFKSPIRARIRDEIWIKLWGNLSFNPISALTGATLEEICNDDATISVVRKMMVEAAGIADKLGARLSVDIEKRIAGAKAVGAHKTSMLQDLERGRPMEINALLGVVQELGTLTGTPTPTIDSVLALVKQRARLAGCFWET